MIRRDFLRSVLFGGTALAATRAGKAIGLPSGDGGAAPAHGLRNLTGTDLPGKAALPTPTATPFPLQDVKILDPDLLRMREQTLAYMLALDSDRLLHNFRVNANLPSSAEPLYNRESPANGWRGHYVGHFLSASGPDVRLDGRCPHQGQGRRHGGGTRKMPGSARRQGLSFRVPGIELRRPRSGPSGSGGLVCAA